MILWLAFQTSGLSVMCQVSGGATSQFSQASKFNAKNVLPKHHELSS